MISITVNFAKSGMWLFMFKSQKSADDCINSYKFSSAEFEIKDDYGQQAIIRKNEIHGILIEDMDLVSEAQIERSIRQARTQLKANNRASADPALRATAAVQNPTFGGQRRN